MTTTNDPTEPRYPDVSVQLIGEDGNAFSIMSRVARALRQAGASQDDLDEYRTESMSGDYDNVLQTAMRWVSVS